MPASRTKKTADIVPTPDQDEDGGEDKIIRQAQSLSKLRQTAIPCNFVGGFLAHVDNKFALCTKR